MGVETLGGAVRAYVGQRSGPDRSSDRDLEETGPVRTPRTLEQLAEIDDFLRGIGWRANVAGEREELLEAANGALVWRAMDEYRASVRKGREVRSPSGYFTQIVRRLRREARENEMLSRLDEPERRSLLARAFGALQRRGQALTAEAVSAVLFELVGESARA